MPAARSRSVADRDTPKPRSDAYVGLLGLSLLALMVAMLFAFLNWNGISEKPPKPVQIAPRGGPAGGGAPAAPPAPGQPVAPAPGQPGAQAAPGQPGAPPAAPPQPKQ